MSPTTVFPHSARAAWLAKRGQQHGSVRISRESPDDAKERRALVAELTGLIREATKDQLRQVAYALGKSSRWVDLVCIEAKAPGMIGKACIKAAR